MLNNFLLRNSQGAYYAGLQQIPGNVLAFKPIFELPNSSNIPNTPVQICLIGKDLVDGIQEMLVNQYGIATRMVEVD